MCGVVGGWGDPSDAAVAALRHRGPDAHGVDRLGDGWWLGHTRLAVLDLDSRSDQPFRRGRVALSYNGELWNFRAVRADLERLGERFETTGDTEVVAAAIDRWGVDALPRLNGMFAMAWWRDGELWLARDRFGEVPLHVAADRRSFASELKALRVLSRSAGAWAVGPGEAVRLSPGPVERRRWYAPPVTPRPQTREDAADELMRLVEAGATERSIADVPACTLLSGGIDSAVVALHLRRTVPGLVAFVAVMDPRSRDLRCAREVAEALDIPLREVRVEAPTADDLASVVEAIEMPHKAQVEIGWACLRLADAMRAEGFKVTFSGEGSDELWASYGFAYHALKTEGWHEYRRDLFLEQERKNFARCNKVFLSRGVECRLPFLSPGLVEHALSLPRDVVADGTRRPKAVLQEAARGLLPASVVDRPKLAFQDGMGMKDAAARAVADPRRFYAAEFGRLYG